MITGKDVEETSTRRLTDLFMTVPGVSVISLNRSSSSVAFRGLRAPFFAGRFGGQNVYTLAFQDGRYMQSPMFGGTFWEQMPLLLWERNRIVWGANLRPVRVKSPILGGSVQFDSLINSLTVLDKWKVVTDVRDHDTVTGAYIQDEIKILENLKATLGVKYEHNTFTESDKAWRASLVYAPWKEHAFRFSVARAFRTPNFVEDAINLPVSPVSGFDIKLIGDKRLDNELLHSLELGYTGRFLEKLDVNVEAFYYDYDNLIVPVFETVEFPFVANRIFRGSDNAVARGLEVDVRYPVTKWWEVRANYSRVDFDDRNRFIDKKALEAGIPLSELGVGQSVFSRLYPSNLANLTMLFRLPEDISARLWLNYSGDIITRRVPDLLDALPVEDYVRFDARIAKGFNKGRGEVSITGQNLLGDYEEGDIISRPTPFLFFEDELFEVDRKVFFAVDLHF